MKIEGITASEGIVIGKALRYKKEKFNITEEFASMFENISDQYFAQRALHIGDVANRVISNLLDVKK